MKTEKRILTFAETEKIELKQKFSDSLPKEIVAFLNTDGGTIYIGVNDDGSVCDVTKLDESLKKVADIIESQILPDSSLFVELGTKFIKGKHIIEINVKKGESLYYIKKYGRSSQGCYIRVGSTCRSMTEEQINTVHNKYLLASAKITEIESSVENPTFQYLKLMLAEKGFSINEKTFAKNLHLLTKDGGTAGRQKRSFYFTDRMEIISTGGLPANLSKEDFYMGVSKPVNEELAKLFIRLDLMEQTGYGIPLVTKRYGKTVFEFLDFFLRVTIPFEFELESDGTQDDTQGGTQNDTLDAWIEEQIRKNPKVTTEELAKTSGKGLRTIKRHIAKLSHIKYVGSGYSGHWEVES